MPETPLSSTPATNSAVLPRWKTILRRDPEFEAHLDGSFSKTHHALPMRSLNVGTLSEQVTFQIVPVEEIESPGWVASFVQLMRPRSLGLSLGPMIAVLFFSLAHGAVFSIPIAVSSFFGVLLFHISVNLFNDYGDHMKGVDRLRPHGGSRVIQNGWVRALEVKRAAWGLMVLAFACGLPAIFLHQGPLAFAALAAALSGLEFGFQRLRLKYRGWSEAMAFALTGPLLCTGFAWAITGEARWTHAALGCIYGSIALMYFHSANFENIMSDSQAGVRTWATRAGFDASKKFFHFTSGLAFSCAVAFVALFDWNVVLIPVVLALGASLMGASLRVHRLASPLSSELAGLREVAITQDWLATLAFAGAYLAIFLQRGSLVALFTR